jgi:hypothetical protein
MLQEPVVADFIKASLDVSFQHPLGARLLREAGEALFQGIGTTAAFAKTIGVSVSESFGYGCERQRVKRLHGPVVHGGNAQGTEFAVCFWDIMPAQWPGSVSVTFEVDCGLEFLSVSSPSYVIYTGRFSAPICCYPMHGQQPGRLRVSQQPLQRLRLAVSACLCCLGNTRLQPSNLHLLSLCYNGSATSLARIDQTDVGISSALPLALASSVLPMLRLLTRLAVRPAQMRGPDEVGSFSVFRSVHRMI